MDGTNKCEEDITLLIPSYINLASFSINGFSDTFAITKPPSTTTIELVATSA